MHQPESLLGELLAKPVGPAAPPRRQLAESDLTRSLEVSGDAAEVVVNSRPEDPADEDTARGVLIEQGLNPEEWEATGFRVSEWTKPNGDPGLSTRFTYKRRKATTAASSGRYPIDELLTAIEPYAPDRYLPRPTGNYGMIVAIGDTQFGKIDGDGVEGSLRRAIECIDKAADRWRVLSSQYDIGEILVLFLGDHAEGFVSQGGANVWRTQLTLTEQIRLTRRMMLHAVGTFAPLADTISFAAVPGNHDQAVRINGKGVTRYDDSHDCESLIAVSDAVKLAAGAGWWDHVQFYVPETDELTVTIEIAGTVVTAVHGHMWRPGKHFDWWKSQAFNANSSMHETNLLVAGHLHHLVVDTDGPRTFIQTPALESESTWFRLASGTTGAPGIVLALTRDGETNHIEHIR